MINVVDAKARVLARARKLREHEKSAERLADDLHREVTELRADKAPGDAVALVEELRRVERIASVQFAHNARALEEAVAKVGGGS